MNASGPSPRHPQWVLAKGCPVVGLQWQPRRKATHQLNLVGHVRARLEARRRCREKAQHNGVETEAPAEGSQQVSGLGPPWDGKLDRAQLSEHLTVHPYQDNRGTPSCL